MRIKKTIVHYAQLYKIQKIVHTMSTILDELGYPLLQEHNRESFLIHIKPNVDWVVLEGNSPPHSDSGIQALSIWDPDISTTELPWIMDKEKESDLSRILLKSMPGGGHQSLLPTSHWQNPIMWPNLTASESEKFRGAHGPIGEYHCLCYTRTNGKGFTCLGNFRTK